MITAKELVEAIVRVFRVDERNMFEPETVDHWIKVVFGDVDSRIKTWLETRLRKYIINEFPGVTPVDTSSHNRFPGWVNQALSRGEEVVYFDQGSQEVEDLENEIRHVIDYFEYMFDNPDEIDPRLYVRDLSRISVEDAIEKSKDWTKWLGKRSVQVDSEGQEEVFRVGNLTWVRLLSVSQLDYEGREMQHCVGSYAVRVKSSLSQIYSLRDASGHPHVTIDVSPSKKQVVQIKGKQNKPPIEKYWEPTIKFLQFGIDKGWFKTFNELEAIGAIEHGGKIFSEQDAPPEAVLNRRVIKAIKAWDINALRTALEDGADPNTEVRSGCPALCDVATGSYRAGAKDFAELLLRYGADVNAVNTRDDNKTPLILLCVDGHDGGLPLMDLFIRHGADVDATTSKGETALFWAAGCGYHKLVKKLLDAGADPNIKDHAGVSPLDAVREIMSADDYEPDEYDCEEIEQLLLRHGAR